MADKEELTEAKQAHHAQLAGEHQRLAQFHAEHAGGKQPETGSVGSQLGGFVGSLESHKFWIIGGIIAIIVIFTVVIPAFQNGLGGNTANTNNNPNASGDYSNSGILPSDISSALDNINQSINGIANQIGGGGGTTTTPPPTTPPTGVFNKPPVIPPVGNPTQTPPPVVTPPPTNPPIPAPQPLYVTVTHWTPTNTPWNSTLSGIAQHEGVSLNRIESLNPNIKNPNLIYAGQQVRVK